MKNGGELKDTSYHKMESSSTVNNLGIDFFQFFFKFINCLDLCHMLESGGLCVKSQDNELQSVVHPSLRETSYITGCKYFCGSPTLHPVQRGPSPTTNNTNLAINHSRLTIIIFRTTNTPCFP